jgi:hypothetical protein
LNKVLATLSSEIVENLSQEKCYVSLYQYSDFLSNLGLSVEANIGYEEIRSGTDDNSLRELRWSRFFDKKVA